MSDVKIAVRSTVVVVDGNPCRVRRNRTLADAGHPVVVEHPELWRTLSIDYPHDGELVDGPAAAAKPKKAAAKKAAAPPAAED